eukprot:TRINITY_DN907_c4_g1_i1.p1 TRINITY_DN907_c4_g1~~TRINITY_DN907_c4_g1_i1.p1  ORF type:complete len:556 (-),score=177.70 TRINITY_DN907_c4_g1_i1:156-1823(-)
MGRRRLCLATLLLACHGTLLAWAQTLKISSTLTIEKTDSKEKTHEDVNKLLAYAKEQKLSANVIRFVENTVQQTSKVLEAAEVVAAQKAVAVPKEFTPSKYKVKAMPKLQTKKESVKKMSATDLKKRLTKGGSLNFETPMIITNSTALFEDGAWDEVRRHWFATRISEDEYLEKELRLEYWPPDKARARLVGNGMLQFEEPELIAFSRFLSICFHGTPAKPKLPGQNTEHCEQTVPAAQMVRNKTELKPLNVFPEIKNAMEVMSDFRFAFIEAGREQLGEILGKKEAAKFMTRQTRLDYQYFVLGPSGSGDKLHAENGLPFYDVLIHGSRRWLLLKEDEMERVAQKAREALEFDKTSAYMFFEEKLPELKEEFGLKNFVEANQKPGDLVYVPSGWFRVSLSLADSISYYQTLLSDEGTMRAIMQNAVWRPGRQSMVLAYCYKPSEFDQLPGLDQDTQTREYLKAAIAKVNPDEAVLGILNVLFQCGSQLALHETLPKLAGVSGSPCTKDVWKKCRAELGEKLGKKKDFKGNIDWVPTAPPQSLKDVRKIAGKDEL